MFSEIVQNHVTNLRNVGPLEGATHMGVAGVPGEGPYMILWFAIEGEQIQSAAYRTYGCPAAIACGSITAVLLTGRTLVQARLLTAQDIARVLGGLPEGKEHCASLAVEALARSLEGKL